MFAALNRAIAYILIAIGIVLVAVGIYLGFFGWLNDGFMAGLRLFGTAGAFGVAISVAGIAFRFAAAAHAKRDPRRWWIQIAVLVIAYGLFGLAAWSTSLLDRIGRS